MITYTFLNSNVSVFVVLFYPVANALQYECFYQVTDDYPSHSDATNVIFKAGDKIIQVSGKKCMIDGPALTPCAVILHNNSIR